MLPRSALTSIAGFGKYGADDVTSSAAAGSPTTIERS
jgi:hypothetical protein